MTCLANASVAFAAGAGDQSGTPGVSGQKPLGYLGTTVVGGAKVDNATDVSLNPKLKIEFDKNVVNSLIWTNNSQCFSMKSSTNEAIPINVTKVDDTVDFSLRQFIFVQPVSPLKPGISYKLIISPNLQAKNGVATLGGTTSGQGVTVAFKTQGVAVQQAPATVTPAPKPATTVVTPAPNSTPSTDNSANGKTTSPDAVTPSSAADPSKPSVADSQNQTTTPDSSANPKPKIDGQTTTGSVSQSPNATKKGSGISATTWITILGAVLLVGWVVVEIIARKKRK